MSWGYDFERLRRDYPLADLAGQMGVKLRRAGQGLQGLCPFHKEKTPSFTVYPDNGHFKCYGCGASGDVVDFVQLRDRCDTKTALTNLTGGREQEPLTAEEQSAIDLRAEERDRAAIEDAERRRREALELWRDAELAPGTPVERYLRYRGISLTPPPTLRYHPWLRHKDGRYTPAMVAAVSAPDGTFAGIHVTHIKHDGEGKADFKRPKSIRGPVNGGAVRLAESHGRIAVAEGIEDALTAMEMADRDGDRVAGWSGLSSTHMKVVLLPKGTAAAFVCADLGTVGEEAARATAQNLAQQIGADVPIIRPQQGGDLNESWQLKREREQAG